MRSITGLQILIFNALMAFALGCGLSAGYLTLRILSPGEFRAILAVLVGIAGLYVGAILAYRAWLALRPLPTGAIPPGSAAETTYHVYLLFFLILFYPITRSGVMPVPLLRLFYLALGARFGNNSYTSGILFDPIFVTVGHNSILGQGSVIVPHAIEGLHLSHERIAIGNNVTIGVNAVVLQGCVIEDEAKIGIGAVVAKNTHIGPGEVWLGVPAKRYVAGER